MQKCIECLMWGRNLDYEYLVWIYNHAINLELKGIAFFKNDGSIKVVAEGREENLLIFVKKLQKGKRKLFLLSPIENFSVSWHEARNDFEDFSISET